MRSQLRAVGETNRNEFINGRLAIEQLDACSRRFDRFDRGRGRQAEQSIEFRQRDFGPLVGGLDGFFAMRSSAFAR